MSPIAKVAARICVFHRDIARSRKGEFKLMSTMSLRSNPGGKSRCRGVMSRDYIVPVAESESFCGMTRAYRIWNLITVLSVLPHMQSKS